VRFRAVHNSDRLSLYRLRATLIPLPSIDGGARQGYPDGEGCLDSRGARQFNRSTVGFDRAPDDAETESGSLDFWGVVLMAAEEALEHER